MTAAEVNGNASDLTPLMAFTMLSKLTLVNAGRDGSDLSPLKFLSLTELTCSERSAQANATVLRECETLQVINGIPI